MAENESLEKYFVSLHWSVRFKEITVYFSHNTTRVQDFCPLNAVICLGFTIDFFIKNLIVFSFYFDAPNEFQYYSDHCLISQVCCSVYSMDTVVQHVLKFWQNVYSTTFVPVCCPKMYFDSMLSR